MDPTPHDEVPAAEVLVHNEQALMASLPTLPMRSPLRQDLVHFLARDRAVEEAAPHLLTSPHFVREALRSPFNPSSSLLSLHARPGTHRHKLSQQVQHAIIECLLCLCPPARSDTPATNLQLLHRQYVTNEVLYHQFCAEMPRILAQLETAQHGLALSQQDNLLRRNRDALNTYMQRQQLAVLACDPGSPLHQHLVHQSAFSGKVLSLIEDYVGEPQFSLPCLSTVLDLRKEAHIRQVHNTFLGCKCKACEELPSLLVQLQSEHDAAKRLDLQHQVNDFLLHRRLFPLQRSACTQQRQHLRPGEVQVLQDFTKVDLLDPGLQILVDLVLCIYSVDDAGLPQHHYVDVLCQSNDADGDCEYIVAAWRHILEHTTHLRGARHIFVWSDGPVKEFRNRFSQRFFASLPSNYHIDCTYDYFIPHHGKNICDAHAFHVKRQVSNFILTREGLVSQHQFSHHEQRPVLECALVEALLGPVQRVPLAAHIASHIQNTSVYVLPSVTTTPNVRTDATELVGITRAHSYRYVRDPETDQLFVNMYQHTNGPFLGRISINPLSIQP